MAAFFTGHFFAPAALLGNATGATTRQIIQRSTSELFELAARAGGAVGEMVFFLWTVFALAFWLLVMVGFFQPHV